MNPRFLSVCSGIEAASVAWEPLGFIPLAFSEIEQFPRAVLTHRFPHVPLHGDFTALRHENWIADADILVGGTPCQSFSVAGKRGSLNDARGNLTLEYVRLVDAIDDLRRARGEPASICVWENVPGVLSTRDNAFGCFLAALAGTDEPLVPRGRWTDAGMVAGPRRRIAWRILDAQYFGLAQRRRRVFVVASARNGFDPAAVLFERESLRRHSPPRRETGENLAPTISARPSGGGGLGTDFDCDGGLIASTGDVSQCLNAGGMGRQDYETETLIAFPARMSATQFASTEGLSPSLCSVNPTAVAFDLRGREGGAQFEGPHDTANLRAASGGSSRSYVAHAIQAGALRENPVSGPMGTGISVDLAYTIEARSEVQAVHTPWAVRHLTPRECERLQGFPDDHTLIPWRGKPADRCPNGHRYKALGNSKAVPVVGWIGARLLREMREARA